jgi:hypothetical protein
MVNVHMYMYMHTTVHVYAYICICILYAYAYIMYVCHYASTLPDILDGGTCTSTCMHMHTYIHECMHNVCIIMYA